jgi:hypothetical protein
MAVWDRNHIRPGTVPKILQRRDPEHRHLKTVACLLLSGRTQAATTAMSFEIAASHAAQLIALAPVNPFAPSPHSTFRHSFWSLVDDIDFAGMRVSARLAVEHFEAHACDIRRSG